ncbi:MAG: metallophosphoesterase family protein [Euryarchaeota archaeon]|nr:metallophosphoesterase family protein [Euryarchaeota archaeon]
MKVAVIADVHSNLVALEAVLSELGDVPVIHCGDLVGYNPWPNEVVDAMRARGIISVMGNHDRAVVTRETDWFNPTAARVIRWTAETLTPGNLEYLKYLPQAVREEGYYMVHGSPLRPIEEYVYPDYSPRVLAEYLDMGGRDVLILGHTHVPFALRLGERLILNPGSVGQPRDGDPRAAYALLDTGKREAEIKRVEYDVGAVELAIQEAGLPRALGQRLRYGL